MKSENQPPQSLNRCFGVLTLTVLHRCLLPRAHVLDHFPRKAVRGGGHLRALRQGGVDTIEVVEVFPQEYLW